MTNKELASLIFPNARNDIEFYEKKYPERNLGPDAVVSRFAPSPTGFVHMGSLLTAFIESFVPKITGGIFYLRIEDTDGKRSVENGVNGIIKDLKDFNIEINEGMTSENTWIGEYGPYIQSERKEIYEAYAKLKKADIIRELPGNDWDFEQREDFEANIFRYLSGDISEDEIVDSLKSK